MELVMVLVKFLVIVVFMVRFLFVRLFSLLSRCRIVVWFCWFLFFSLLWWWVVLWLCCSMIRKNSNMVMVVYIVFSYSDGNRLVVVCLNWLLRLVDFCSRFWELWKMEFVVLVIWNSFGVVLRILFMDWLMNLLNSCEVWFR